MGKFIVQVREVHVVSYEVEADSIHEAADKLEDSWMEAGVERGVEYSHQLDRDTWTGYAIDATNGESYFDDLVRKG